MKSVLIVIPELSYSGSAFSSLRICKALLKHNYNIGVWSYSAGAFSTEFKRVGVDAQIIDRNSVYDNEDIIEEIKCYDLLIANTVVVHAIADVAKNIIPTIWYIREAANLEWQFLNKKNERYYAFMRAENLYVVSEYAQEFIRDKYHKDSRVVHNCVEDEYDKYYDRNAIDDDKVRFLALGTLEDRKAFDFMISGFEKMHSELRLKSELHFAGRVGEEAYTEKLLRKASDSEGVYYHGEIQKREWLMHLMNRMDVVVVPSKDESCSLVALEAAMMAKPLIVSVNVGAKYLISEDNGWIFDTGNVLSLMNTFEDAVRGKELLKKMGEKSRDRYLETSTFEIYEKNILKMVDENLVDDIDEYRLEHEKAEEQEKLQRKCYLNCEYVYDSCDSVVGKRIVIYGAGRVGNDFYKWAVYNKCIINGWVDRDNVALETNKDNRIPISAVGEINNMKYDYICIAVKNRNMADEIMNDLREFTSIDHLIWVNPQ